MVSAMILILAQLNEYNLRLNDLESWISKPYDQEVAGIEVETSGPNRGENGKNEKEQAANERVNTNQGSKLNIIAHISIATGQWRKRWSTDSPLHLHM